MSPRIYFSVVFYTQHDRLDNHQSQLREHFCQCDRPLCGWWMTPPCCRQPGAIVTMITFRQCFNMDIRTALYSVFTFEMLFLHNHASLRLLTFFTQNATNVFQQIKHTWTNYTLCGDYVSILFALEVNSLNVQSTNGMLPQQNMFT